MKTYKHNTGYSYISIWRTEWAVESQKVLHLNYTGDFTQMVYGVRIKQWSTILALVDFRECKTADILINAVSFGTYTFTFEYVYIATGGSTWITHSISTFSITINQKTIINTDVVPRCTGQVLDIDNNTTLFTPPTINLLTENITQTLIWGYKGAESLNFSMRINVNNVITTLTTKSERFGTNNTKTRWFYTSISTQTAIKIQNGGVLEILDADSNVVWRGGRVCSLGNVNTAANDVLQCQSNNFSTNNRNPFILVGIIEDSAEFEPAEFNSDRYRVGDTFEGLKVYNDTTIIHTIQVPNLTMYDIWLYTALLANCPRYILTNHTLNFQNEQSIYYVKKWNVEQPTERDNGVLTITLLRYGND